MIRASKYTDLLASLPGYTLPVSVCNIILYWKTGEKGYGFTSILNFELKYW